VLGRTRRSLSLEQQLLTHQQTELLNLAKSVAREKIDAGEYLPCFGLISDGQGHVQKFIPQCVHGQEQQVFSDLVDSLKSGVSAGAICTALVILLEPSTDGSTSAATVDLDQKGEQRMIAFLPYSKSGSKSAFDEPTFTAKPSVLFRAP
jgi:hypothetical protein